MKKEKLESRPRTKKMIVSRVIPTFCRNFLRVIYTQFRLFKLRVFLTLSIFLVSFVACVSFGVVLNRSDDVDPTIPIVRSTSWDHRLNRKGLSLPETEENIDNMDVTLLVLIHASGNSIGRKRRDVIRKTWVSNVILNRLADSFGTRIMYKFVLGGKDPSREFHQRISLESKQYHDMIVLGDVTDEHETLTQRTISSFTYVVNKGYQYDYILKCDDDTFVDLRAIMTYLVNRSDTSLHWGSFVGGYDILSDGPYAENSWYICDKYLPYAFGGGYILSRDLIELLAMNAPYLKLYKNEDVSVSAWLAPYNLERMHDLKFDTQADSHGCMRPFTVVHKISITKMKEYFLSLQTEGIICGERTRTHTVALLTHYYNWTVLPIRDCCSNKRTKQLWKHQPYA